MDARGEVCWLSLLSSDSRAELTRYVKGTGKPGELSYEQVLAMKDIKDMSEAERHTRDVGSLVL